MTTALAEVITDWVLKKTVMRDRGRWERALYNQCTLHRAGLIKDLVHG